MKKFKPLKLLIFIILVAIILIIGQERKKEGYDRFYKMEIIGVIESIKYSPQSTPIVKIKGENHHLGFFSISKRDGLSVGDSIYKKKNSKFLQLHSKTSTGSYLYTERFEMR